jgi:hypothetical protein
MIQAVTQVSNWEYTQASCDIWQVGHLCTYFALKGWEPVQVFPSVEGIRVLRDVTHREGTTMLATAPHEVLFRRPIPTEEDE